MKLKDGFITYQDGDTQVLIPTGGQNFAGLVRSNETAAYIINIFKEETTYEQAVENVMQHYSIDREKASGGVDKVLNQLREIGALDE